MTNTHVLRSAEVPRSVNDTEVGAAPSLIDLSHPRAIVSTSVEGERCERKRRLAASLRIFASLGFDEGVAGHVTVRDPENENWFWVNPFGIHFSHVRSSDLVLVRDDGVIVEGDHPINRSAFAIHSQIHLARPDCVAAAHAHSLHGRTWAALGRPLDPITQNSCPFFEDHALFNEYSGPVLELRDAKRIANTLRGCKAAILQNHGLLTVGRTVDEAAWWFIAMERACQVQLMAEAVGPPIVIDPATARATRDHNGTHDAGWFSFQPLYSWIVRKEPDLLT